MSLKDNEIKLFLEKFFKDSKLDKSGDVLSVFKAPEGFAKIYGKDVPYKFVFNLKKSKLIKDCEFITQGSYLISIIREYLSDKGESSLVEIKFSNEYLNQIKNKGSLSKKIKEIKFDDKYGLLTEFKFLSEVQYLNEKKHFTSSVMIQDGKNREIDLSEFEKTNLTSISVKINNIDKEYETAIKCVKEEINEKTAKVKNDLKDKLGIEARRIIRHYVKQTRENDEEVNRCEQKIRILKSKLTHTFYNRDIKIINRKIKEQVEQLKLLEKNDYKTRLEKEEEFHISDEINKHSLSINHKIINISIILYPILKLILTGNKEILFDPIKQKQIT